MKRYIGKGKDMFMYYLMGNDVFLSNKEMDIFQIRNDGFQDCCYSERAFVCVYERTS